MGNSINKKIINKHRFQPGQIPWNYKHSVTIEEITKLFNDGFSVNVIAKNLKCDRKIIVNRMLKAGIKPRNRSESMFLRMSQTSIQERKRIAEKANIALRKFGQPLSGRIKRAITAQKTGQHIGAGEKEFFDWMNNAGFDCVMQYPAGVYNIDIMVNNILAVEIHWTTGNPHSCDRTIKRIEYLLNSGFSVFYIKVTKTHPLTIASANYAISFAQEISRNPSFICQYRMIRGDGDFIAKGCLDNEHLTIINSSS